MVQEDFQTAEREKEEPSGKTKKKLQFQNKNDAVKQASAKPQPPKPMGPIEVRELNQKLEDYVEVPRSSSLINMRYIPTPPRRQSEGSHHSSDMEDDEDYELMLVELYSRASRYTLDINEYERYRAQLMDYLVYRRKFEQS